MSELRRRGGNNTPTTNANNTTNNATEEAKVKSTSYVDEFVQSLFDEVPAYSLVFTRIMWSIIFVWECYRFSLPSKVQSNFAPESEGGPLMQLRYYPFSEDVWPPRVSTETFGYIMYVNMALASCMAVGFLYRITAPLFFVGFLFVYLQEASLYLNHLYLACCLNFLFAALPLNHMWSLDAALGIVTPKRTVPRWCLWLLRVVVSNVYVWAGIAKMNYDWMVLATPLKQWLPKRVGAYPGVPLWDTLMDSELVAYGMSWTGMLYDTFLPALFYAGGYFRVLGFLASAAFHTSNHFIFEIGIFPFFALMLAFVYFEPDWPLRWTQTLFSVAGWHVSEKPDARSDVERKRPRGRRFSLTEMLVVAFCALVVAQQFLFPFRQWLYKGDVQWTERGHRYSWRMKLRDKAGMVKCALNYGADEWLDVETEAHLFPRQRTSMQGRPEEIHQFAEWLARRYTSDDGQRPAVHCLAVASVNFRQPQYFIDPRINLAGIPVWTRDDYIVELLSREEATLTHPFVPAPQPNITLEDMGHNKRRIVKYYSHLKFQSVLEQFAEFEKRGLVRKVVNNEYV